MKELTIRKIIFSLIIFICAYYYYCTLVIYLWHYLVILCVALLIDLVLYFTLNLKFNLISIVKTIVHLYFFLFSILFIIAKFDGKTETYRLPLNGYTYNRVDKILFTFKGHNFGRFHSLPQYSLIADKDMTKLYDVLLELKEPIRGIYIIEYISLEKKIQANKLLKFPTLIDR